jgi:hypothetical protein
MRHSTATIDAGQVWIQPGDVVGTGTLTIPGHASMRLDWSGLPGDEWCQPWLSEGNARPFVITGRLRVPHPSVVVQGCGGSVRPDLDGIFVLEVERTPCEVEARRYSGAVAAAGPSVMARADEDIVLDFPDFEPAGLGIVGEPVGEGILIVHVAPGSPAAQAALTPGDLLIAVNAMPTRDHTWDAVRGSLVGPEDSPVMVDVVGSTGPRSITLHRELDRGWRE